MPDEFHLPLIEDHLGRMKPLGWYWAGDDKLHLFPGVSLEEVNQGGWTWQGEVAEASDG